MTPDQVNWAAVRAFRRLLAPLLADLNEAAAADAGFDAGEWSGEWHAEHMWTEVRKLENRVAERFGIPRATFHHMTFIDIHWQDDCTMRAIRSARADQDERRSQVIVDEAIAAGSY